jgi:hypothetical protein
VPEVGEPRRWPSASAPVGRCFASCGTCDPVLRFGLRQRRTTIGQCRALRELQRRGTAKEKGKAQPRHQSRVSRGGTAETALFKGWQDSEENARVVGALICAAEPDARQCCIITMSLAPALSE